MSKIRNNRMNTCCGHDGIRLVDKYINTSFDIVYTVYENLDELKGLVNSSDEEIQKRVDEIINQIETSSKELKPLIEDLQKGTYDNGQRQLVISLKDVKEDRKYKYEIKDYFREEVYIYDLLSSNLLNFSADLQEKLNKHYPGKGLVVLPKDCGKDNFNLIVIDRTTERLTLNEINIFNDKERYEFNWYKSTSSISNLMQRMDEFERLMTKLDELNESDSFDIIKDVHKNLDRLNEIYESLDKLESLTEIAESLEESSKLLEVNNFVIVVNSEEELDTLNTNYFKSARVIVKDDDSIGFSDYVYISNKWLKVSTTKSNDQFLSVAFIYRGGSAIGGETEIKFDSEVNSINAVYLNGIRNMPSKLGKLNYETNKFELIKPLEKGDELIFIFTDTETTTIEFSEARKIAKEALELAEKNREDISKKRDLSNNVFDGPMSIKSDNDDQGVGIFLQESAGTVRGQVVATDQGLQLTQYPKDGGLQTFTFPIKGGEVLTKEDAHTLYAVGDPRVFGYIGDGQYHPLSEVYGSLSEAREYFPFINSLDQSIDWASIQHTLNKFNKCVISGKAVVTDTIHINNGGSLLGSGVGEWTPMFSHLMSDSGTQILFYGSGKREFTVRNISSMEEVVNFKNNSYSEDNYPNSPSEYYRLTDFTNRDAAGSNPASSKKFSVGVVVKGTANIKGVRLMPYLEPEKYKNTSDTSLGANWDVGIWLLDSNRSNIENSQIVGYWRIAALLKTTDIQTTNNAASSEGDLIVNSVLQGMASVLIRGADSYNIEKIVGQDIFIRFPYGHQLPYSGSVRILGANYRYDSIREEGSYLVLTITDDVSKLKVNSRLEYLGGSPWGSSGTTFKNCYISGLSHHSRLLSSNVELMNGKVSRAIEISGNPARGIRFESCSILTPEDIAVFLHECRDAQFHLCYFEGKNARSEIGGNVNSILNGTRFIATRKATSKVKYGDSTIMLYLSGCTRNFIDMLPSLDRFNAPRYSSGDVGYFEPREFVDDYAFNPPTGDKYQLNIPYTSKEYKFMRDESLISYSNDINNLSITVDYQFNEIINRVGYRYIIANKWDNKMYQFDSTKFSPVETLKYNLGDPSARWATIYGESLKVINPVETTSDRRSKESITDIDEKYLNIVPHINYRQYLLYGEDATYFGVIAQEVIEACKIEGVDYRKLGIVVGSEEEGYSVRYDALSSLVLCYVLRRLNE